MSNLGTAYVQIVPQAQGITGAIESQLGGSMNTVGGSTGKKFMGGFGKTALKALGGLGIATSIGSVLSKGFSRMTAIDNAKAKLTALGNSAGDVAKISDNALKSVQGTAYGLDAAMTTAASATAAGIKPGKELSRYLGLVGDAAAVAGTSMDEMGSIFNKVAANGKVTTMEMNQLADRGIPIWQLLAKETGMSMDELRSAVEAGKVDINDFQNAIETGMGGAAKTIGSTTIQGAIQNIGASVSRMGANLLGSADDADSFAGRLLPLMNNLMDFMGKVESGASVLGSVIGSVIGPVLDGIGQGLSAIGDNSGKLSPLKDMLIEIGQGVGSVISQLMPLIVPIIQNVMRVIGVLMEMLKPLMPIISAAFDAVKLGWQIISPILAGVMSTVGAVVDFLTGKLSFSGLVEKVKEIWSKVKEKITEPIKKAKEKVKEIIDKIKGYFPLKIGKIFKGMKLPHFTVSGKAPFGIGGKGVKPKISVNWYAKGGIVDGATLIGAGERGPEAIVPLDAFWKKVDDIPNSIVNGLSTALMMQSGGAQSIALTVNLGGAKVAEQVYRLNKQGKLALEG